jgi:hypothetical protein
MLLDERHYAVDLGFGELDLALAFWKPTLMPWMMTVRGFTKRSLLSSRAFLSSSRRAWRCPPGGNAGQVLALDPFDLFSSARIVAARLARASA